MRILIAKGKDLDHIPNYIVAPIVVLAVIGLVAVIYHGIKWTLS